MRTCPGDERPSGLLRVHGGAPSPEVRWRLTGSLLTHRTVGREDWGSGTTDTSSPLSGVALLGMLVRPEQTEKCPFPPLDPPVAAQPPPPLELLFPVMFPQHKALSGAGDKARHPERVPGDLGEAACRGKSTGCGFVRSLVKRQRCEQQPSEKVVGVLWVRGSVGAGFRTCELRLHRSGT